MAHLPLKEVADRLDATLDGDPALLISGVADPRFAKEDEIAVLTDASRIGEAWDSRACAFLVRYKIEDLDRAQLIVADPRRSLGRLLALFAAVDENIVRGVDPRSAVASSASVDPSAWIAPFCFVDEHATIGARSRIAPFCFIGRNAKVGCDCSIGPGVTLFDGCTIEDRVALEAGAVVGRPGFGYWAESDGWHHMPSRGAVVIGDDSAIGANTCVDRGTLCDTVVGEGVKIDNLVQVGHNANLADRVLICAQTGLAGSVRIGSDTVLGGQVGVADHCEIQSGARIGAKSGVIGHVPEETVFTGMPAMPHAQWLRSSAYIRRLGEFALTLHELQEKVAHLEKLIAESEIVRRK